MIIDDIFSDIIEISSTIIEKGLSVKENQPYRTGDKITWRDEIEISKLMRKISYLEKYKLLEESTNYNFKLLDGAFIQMQYVFDNSGSSLIGHRLAYYPSPLLERYENAPKEYQELYFGESEYHDIIPEFTITTPIRFDYSSSIDKFKDIHHPYSHVHFGEYETCRIPLGQPLSPKIFVNFILRNFYNTAVVDYCDNLHFDSTIKMMHTITENERKLLHFNFE